jgi:transposase
VSPMGRGAPSPSGLRLGRSMNCPMLCRCSSACPVCRAGVVADRSYSSHAFRQPVWDTGARSAIPTKRNEAPIACPDWVYVNRNRVERLWARLKEWRAVATRYEKTATSFMGVLCLAATIDWIKT